MRRPERVASARTLGAAGHTVLAFTMAATGWLVVEAFSGGGSLEQLLVALVAAGVVGLLMTATAWVRSAPVLGAAAKVAGSAMMLMPLAGLALFFLVPPSREWGRLGGLYAGTLAASLLALVSGIAGGLALVRVRPRPSLAYPLAGYAHWGSALLVVLSIFVFRDQVPAGVILAFVVLVLSHAFAALAFLRLPLPGPQPKA